MIDPVEITARAVNIGAILLMMIGLFTTFAAGHLVKRLIGLSIFQVGIFVFYIGMAKVSGAVAPILVHNAEGLQYSNPLPSALILTAIVVSLATLAIGLAIVVRIKEAYGSVEVDDLVAADSADETDQRP